MLYLKLEITKAKKISHPEINLSGFFDTLLFKFSHGLAVLIFTYNIAEAIGTLLS